MLEIDWQKSLRSFFVKNENYESADIDNLVPDFAVSCIFALMPMMAIEVSFGMPPSEVRRPRRLTEIEAMQSWVGFLVREVRHHDFPWEIEQESAINDVSEMPMGDWPVSTRWSVVDRAVDLLWDYSNAQSIDHSKVPGCPDEKLLASAGNLIAAVGLIYLNSAIKSYGVGDWEAVVVHLSDAYDTVIRASELVNQNTGRFQQRLAHSSMRRAGAIKGHQEDYALKASAKVWFNENRSRFFKKGRVVKDQIAEEISRRVVAVKFRTARAWVDEWESNLRFAS